MNEINVHQLFFFCGFLRKHVIQVCWKAISLIFIGDVTKLKITLWDLSTFQFVYSSSWMVDRCSLLLVSSSFSKNNMWKHNKELIFKYGLEGFKFDPKHFTIYGLWAQPTNPFFPINTKHWSQLTHSIWKIWPLFSRPLFTIIFRPEMLKFHPCSILTGDTMVGFVTSCVLRYIP